MSTSCTDAKPPITILALAGTFELEGRLLHKKDALVLWEVDTVELEALSNHALIWLLELLP